MLKRSRRDMASLYGLLDRLDLEALRAQRRLTIPFVRDVLQGSGV
jgi:DnaA family protein